ncbi:transposase [Nonomuraea sp. NPDC049141]|uniref:transposase n=1 Tax=Nonomuraea sp. NPDC049141 TaxID=3155500 RepID=UPI00340A1D3F
MSVKPWVVDDELWALIEPALPSWPERPPGPRPVPDRLCLQEVLFVLYTGIPWQQLPLELGFGSGQTGGGWSAGRRQVSSTTRTGYSCRS